MMWFGTDQKMSWIKPPATGIGMSDNMWFSSSTYLNGGAAQRQSSGSHREYTMSWGPASREALSPILAYLSGAYGNGMFYFVDPIAAKVNMMPSWLSIPWLATQDAPSFIVDERPTLVTGTAGDYEYPTQSAYYNVDPSDRLRTFRFPVPPDYTLHFGAHGSVSGSGALVLTPDNDDPIDVEMLDSFGSVLTNTQIDGPCFVDISLGGTGTVVLNALIARVLPNGQSSPQGVFVPGLGNSGVKLSGPPQTTGYSAAIERASIGVTASFIEVGGWL